MALDDTISNCKDFAGRRFDFHGGRFDNCSRIIVSISGILQAFVQDDFNQRWFFTPSENPTPEFMLLNPEGTSHFCTRYILS